MLEKDRIVKELTLEEIKKLVVIAMFSDDELMDKLVLKGGNALDLIYQISNRTSLELDFSMPDDFPMDELEKVRKRVEGTLHHSFLEVGYEVFDVVMNERPETITPEMSKFWGGYYIEFKLINSQEYKRIQNALEVDRTNELRKYALQIGPGKKFLIEISRHEFTEDKEAKELDGYRIFVYSIEMILCEKLRAICQQMPEYNPIVKRSRQGGARARDFIDIHTLMTQGRIDLKSDKIRDLLAAIFAAKKVPLSFLHHIDKYRDFHKEDFPAVQATVKPGMDLNEFDYYFDFVLRVVDELKALGYV